jgi:hypothetical protein
MSLPQTSLEDAYGRSFGSRTPIRESGGTGPAPLAQPEFTSLAQKAERSVKSNAGVIQNLLTSGSLPIAEAPRREAFRVEEPRQRAERTLEVRDEQTIAQREAAREQFTERPRPATDDDKLTRILRLIEQNKTGYERPVVQDMLLYVFTGVFFLFTLDTFVLLGKSMRKGKKGA